MPCDPDCLRRGVAPRCQLLVFIALGIPRQDMTLAERYPRSTKSRQLQSCQEEEVKPVVLLERTINRDQSISATNRECCQISIHPGFWRGTVAHREPLPVMFQVSRLRREGHPRIG
jgi:hypothetical protein